MTSTTPSPHTAVTTTEATAVGAALGRIPSGLFVVTWRDGDCDRGMLASWVMQAGFEPPMLTVAVGHSRDLLAAVRAGRPFVVNVLAESQRSLLGRFGKPDDDPFSGLTIDRTAAGIAALADAAAWLECRPQPEAVGGALSVGDHVVVVATVTAAGSGGEKQPLVHLRKNGLRY